MQLFLQTHIHWLTALHIIAVISWMAAQLYLPRLFVYHAGATPGGELSETLKVMERRLLKAIMTPAMIATLVFGILLLYAKPALAGQLWFTLKMLAILGLLATHGMSAKAVRLFASDANTRSARYYRFLNEVPTVCMVSAVVCVIVLKRAYPFFA